MDNNFEQNSNINEQRISTAYSKENISESTKSKREKNIKYFNPNYISSNENLESPDKSSEERKDEQV
jgi:hypothetical protein